MTKTLYVGNLPWAATDAVLTDAFREYGTVISSRIITDRDTGRSRGFGFVEVEYADFEKLVEALNGAEIGGRHIVVSEANPRQN